MCTSLESPPEHASLSIAQELTTTRASHHYYRVIVRTARAWQDAGILSIQLR